MRLHRLRDDQWDRIKDDLPGRAGSVGVTATDNRLFVDAVLYRYRTGIPWRIFWNALVTEQHASRQLLGQTWSLTSILALLSNT